MKFFSKYKKQIFSVFLCVAFFSCFIGFSLSSSASVENIVTDLTVSQVSFQISDEYQSQFGSSRAFAQSGGSFFFDTSYNVSSPLPLFKRLVIASGTDYLVPSYSGRSLSLSLNLDFVVSDHGYLDFVPSSADISNSAIFTGCYIRLFLSDGSIRDFSTDTFLLIDDNSGQVLDPHSDDYWDSIKGGVPWNFSIYALFDISSVLGLTIESTYIFFPDSISSIYYDNTALNSYITLSDISLNVDFAYSPFDDVVQDDLSDIKGSLSGVNNRLDSISSSMNTIDADVNRVNQKLDQTNETLGDINQGIQDILKPSAPAVDFKNQWNDYFENNPIPDLSALPNYDMTQMVLLLDDSSHIIQSIFSPFFLRDYVVSIPLTQSSQSARFDPVAVYISLCFGLSLGFIMVRLLKGSRG